MASLITSMKISICSNMNLSKNVIYLMDVSCTFWGIVENVLFILISISQDHTVEFSMRENLTQKI